MTVAELIQALQAMPQDMLVVTPGFDESDLDTISEVKLVWAKLHARPDNQAHRGEHDEADEGDEGAVQCVYIDW